MSLMSISVLIFMRRVWGRTPLESRQFFVGDVENAVLTLLTHTADVVLSRAQLVTEPVSAFSTSHALQTSHGETARPPEDVEADVVEVVGHLFTFHANKVSEKSAWVKRFLQKKSKKNRTKKLDENLDGWV